MFGHVEVYDLASLVLEHREHAEDSKTQRGDNEEIDGSEVPDVIVEERSPALRRRLTVVTLYFATVAWEMSMPSICSSL